MSAFWVLLGFCFILPDTRADTCWVYDYEYDYSSIPYKRVFTCPCGCCGSTWTRECCPSEPVCYHNNTFLRDEEDSNQDDEIRDQALILSGIAIGTFLLLLAMTAAVHLCGRGCSKQQPVAPNVTVYNVHGPPGDIINKPATSIEEPVSGMSKDPPAYKTVTTEL